MRKLNHFSSKRVGVLVRKRRSSSILPNAFKGHFKRAMLAALLLVCTSGSSYSSSRYGVDNDDTSPIDTNIPPAPPLMSKTNPNLRYFSMYGVEGLDPAMVKGWVNFLATTNHAQIARFHTAKAGSSLFSLQSTLFCGPLLCPDYKTKWRALLNSTIEPGLADGSLMGVHFGDELCWMCTPWTNLSAAVDLVRTDLPRGKAILTYNEAYPVFTLGLPERDGGLWQWNCDTGGGTHPPRPAPGMANVSYPRVPEGLDWLSLDYYPSEGTVAGVARLFREQIYPKMSAAQKVMFVPPGYGADTPAHSNQLCCSNSTRDGPNPPCNGDCATAMLVWAKGIYDWARTDPRIAALNVFHYDSSATPGLYQPGVGKMPSVLAAWKLIGAEIVSGQLRDLDFSGLI